MARNTPRRSFKPTPTPAPPRDARAEKAWRAVREFNKMLPSFNGFVQMMTGDSSVRVVASKSTTAQAYSLDNRIYIVPPIELGDDDQHTRNLCSKREPNGRQKCKACDTREVVLFYVYHEVGHIVGKSFDSPADFVLEKMMTLVDEWHPEGVCNHGRRIKAQMMNEESNYLGLSSIVNPFLPVLVNVLDDARVDAGMFRVRPGLRAMFKSGALRIMENGVALHDGRTLNWNEQPINAQVATAMFYRASGHRIEPEWFDPRVIEVLDDPELANICGRATITRTPHQVVELSIEAYRRLYEMGLMQAPKCEPAPPAPPSDPSKESGDKENDANQPGQDGKPDSDSGDAGDGNPTDGGESSDSTDGSGKSGSKDDDAGATGAQASPDGQPGPGGSDDQPEGEQPTGGASEPGEPEGDPQGSPESSGNGDGDDKDGPEENNPTSLQGDVPKDEADPLPEDEDGSGARPPVGGTGNPDGGDPEGDPELDHGTDSDTTSEAEDSNPSGEDADDARERSDGTESDRPEAGQPEDEGAGDGESDGTEASTSDGSIPDGGDEPGDDDRGETSDPDLGPTGADVWETEHPEPQYPQFEPDELGSDASLIEQILEAVTGHSHESDDGIDHGFVDGNKSDSMSSYNNEQNVRAMEKATGQALHFEGPSVMLHGIQVSKYPNKKIHWPAWSSRNINDWMIPESLIVQSLLHARVTFEANMRAKHEHNLRAGRVNSKVLGRRAPTGDDRIFSKKTVPSKRSYFVALGVDASGSTANYDRNPRIKRAVMAQAEMLHRLGIAFTIYGMSGGPDMSKSFDDLYENQDNYLWMMPIKTPDQPWDNNARQRLVDLEPAADNFDGHNIEFLRKICDRRLETDRIICYYTDGAMPAANAEEELFILQQELDTCKKKRYPILGVGINTDSPSKYGLNTVRVDEDADLIKVVHQLRRALEE